MDLNKYDRADLLDCIGDFVMYTIKHLKWCPAFESDRKCTCGAQKAFLRGVEILKEEESDD
jgi:hypothetical protein